MNSFEKSKYWLELAYDDIETAKWLLEGNKLLECGLFCHLAVEKALKAVVTEVTKEIPPRVHDLLRLARLGKVYEEITEQQIDFLDEITPLQIEARYPEYKDQIALGLSNGICGEMIAETEELLCWIKQQL